MIRQLNITALRGIEFGDIGPFAALTVIVGPNGAGKSTLLDAILIGTSPVPWEGLGRSILRRQFVARAARWLVWRADDQRPATIEVTCDNGDSRKTTLQFIPRTEQTEDRVQVSMSQKGSVVADISHEIRFTDRNEYDYGRIGRYELRGVPEVRFVDVSARSGQAPLHAIYSDAVETGRRRQARDIVTNVVEDLEDIEILSEQDVPVVHLVFADGSVPVALAGDGIHSLVRLSLELAARRGGIALLEEPEAHQHPRAIRQTTQAILEAVRRGIQVVLTTHSLELIDGLIEQAKPAEYSSMALFRVQLRKGKLLAVDVPGKEIVDAREKINDDLR